MERSDRLVSQRLDNDDENDEVGEAEDDGNVKVEEVDEIEDNGNVDGADSSKKKGKRRK